MLKVFKEAFGFWGTLGVILGAVAIFNLIVKGFELGLAPIMRDILNVYIYLFHGLFDWLFHWIGWDVPSWLKDIFSIWLVHLGISIRCLISLRNFEGLIREEFKGRLNKDAAKTQEEKFLETYRKQYTIIIVSLLFPVALYYYILIKAKILGQEYLGIGLPEPAHYGEPWHSFIRNRQTAARDAVAFQFLAVLMGITLLLVTNAGLQMGS